MERIILIHWSMSTGPELVIQYPPEKIIPSKDLFLKIWAKHELNKEISMIKFNSEDDKKNYLSIIQELEGEIYFFILVINELEMLDDLFKNSPDILALISKNLVELINTNKITRAISEAFNTIKNYSKLDEEENLISFFKDKIKFTILTILRNGVISKSNLTSTLRDKYGFSTINIDLLLISFIKEGLIVKKNIPGSKECYFLVKDLSCTRIPPKNFQYEEIEENLLKRYNEALKKLYIDGKIIADFESKTIIQTVLLDKDVFNLLKTIRESRLSVNDCLIILNNREELFKKKKVVARYGMLEVQQFFALMIYAQIL